MAGILALAVLAAVSACTSEGPPANPAATATAVLAPTGSDVPVEDEAAIRRTIDGVNATARGPVGDQRSALSAVVDPSLASTLDQCPTATSTLLFDPVYRDLRAVPGWAAPSGPLTGTVYALPSLVRIYTGDRITGTDLTTLHFGVQQGEAYLTPLCVG
jgi:hypothetical protein